MTRYIIAIAVVLTCAHAQAQPAPCRHELSVPAERERAASELIEQAYEQHKQLNYDQAAALYRQALEQWDRPDIHRQAGMAYFYAARLLDAYHHLSEALRCGQEWLKPEDYAEARTLMQRLGPWFGEVEVRVRSPGTDVRFDGESWFRGPGSRSQVVMAGQHVISVTRAGHIPVRKLVFVSPGERSVIEPKLLRIDQGTVVSRRWKRWQPWAVIGAGAAVGLIGAGFEWRAVAGFDAYERDVRALCDDDEGCRAPEQGAVRQQWNAATRDNRLAIGAFIAGGAIVAAGVTLVVLNRPRQSKHPDAGRAGVRVVPMASPAGAGMSLQMSF